MERIQIEEIADRLCERYDEISYTFFNRILEQVREEASTAKTLGKLAINTLEAPEIL